VGIELTKSAIDLGIVVRDKDAALRFYRDTLGFTFVEESALAGGTKMQRLMCGDSMIKLVSPGTPPEAQAPGGGVFGASGYRYWTISVANLEEVVGAAKAAGYRVPVDVTEIAPGRRIAMVEDPDGNWVEFLQSS